VVLIGLEQADDKAIRQYAIDDGFVIVSKDVDFFEMNSLYAMARTILDSRKGSLATDEYGFTRINKWLYPFFVTPFG
jgi:predicted nuclease of predicted toxin-antitoxin system